MLARYVRTIMLSVFVAWAIWAGLCLNQGSPSWIALPILLAFSVHAFVIALEFVLLYRLARLTGSAAPRWTAMIAAWLGEMRVTPRVFCWEQPFRSQRWIEPLSLTGAKRARGVLLVHGYVCNRGLWNNWLERFHVQQIPFRAVSMEPVLGSIDAYRPIIDRAVAELTAMTGLAPVAVAHSMGGLAVRNWWAAAAADADRLSSSALRLHRLITLGTPHKGTWLARLGFTDNARQMRENSEWLVALSAREPASHRERTTCFYSPCDNIVFPFGNATLDGADNRRLEAVAHVAMIDRPEPFAELQRQLHGPSVRPG